MTRNATMTEQDWNEWVRELRGSLAGLIEKVRDSPMPPKVRDLVIGVVELEAEAALCGSL